MKHVCLIALVLCAVLASGALFAADERPIYTGAVIVAHENNTYACILPKDAKPADVLAFYQDKLKLGEWAPCTSVDSPWLYLRSYTEDGRAFGLAVYGGKLCLLDDADATDGTIADWVREMVLVALPPVAKVGADGVSYADYYHRVERLPYADQNAGQTTEAGLLVLQRLLTEQFLLKMAQDREVSPTEQQIQARTDQSMKQPAFVGNLRKAGITPAQLKELMRVEQAAFNLQTKGITVTPAEIVKYYNDHRQEFVTPEQILLAGVFVNTKKDADKAMSLLKSGVQFSTVARTLSKHPSAQSDGKLAPLSRGDTGIPEYVQDTIFGTAVGEYTEPIASGDGSYVIFQVVEHNPKKVKKLADVRDLIRDRVMLDKGMKQNPDINTDLTALRGATDIEVYIERYADLVKGAWSVPADGADADSNP